MLWGCDASFVLLHRAWRWCLDSVLPPAVCNLPVLIFMVSVRDPLYNPLHLSFYLSEIYALLLCVTAVFSLIWMLWKKALWWRSNCENRCNFEITYLDSRLSCSFTCRKNIRVMFGHGQLNSRSSIQLVCGQCHRPHATQSRIHTSRNVEL